MSEDQESQAAQAQSPTHRDWRRPLQTAILVVLLGWTVRETASVTMPLAFSLFIVVLYSPLENVLRRHLPKSVAVVLTFISVLASLGGMLAALWLCAQMISEHLQSNGGGMGELQNSLADLLSRFGLSVPERAGKAFQAVGRVAGDLAGRLADAAGGLVLVVTLAMLAISERQAWRRKLGEQLGESSLETATTISSRCRSYVLTRAFTSALTGLLTGLLTWVVGLDLAYVWGIVAFLLNFVPTLGSIIAIIPPTLLAVVQLGGLAAFGVFAALTVIQIALGNYLDPKLQGKTLRLSPFVLLFSIGFWSYLWGVGGALLAIPLTMAAVVICDQFPRSRWLAAMVADEPARTE